MFLLENVLQLTEMQKIWITTLFSCMFLQILFAGRYSLIYVVFHVYDSNTPWMLAHFLNHVQIMSSLHTSMVSQCRSDIGILVIVNQVNIISFSNNLEWYNENLKIKNWQLSNVITLDIVIWLISFSFIIGFRMQKSCA